MWVSIDGGQSIVGRFGEYEAEGCVCNMSPSIELASLIDRPLHTRTGYVLAGSNLINIYKEQDPASPLFSAEDYMYVCGRMAFAYDRYPHTASLAGLLN